MPFSWHDCTVVRTGCGDYGFFVMLQDASGRNEFTPQWFYLHDSCRKEMLAVAMAALTSKLKVQVLTDLAVRHQNGDYCVVHRMYLVGS